MRIFTLYFLLLVCMYGPVMAQQDLSARLSGIQFWHQLSQLEANRAARLERYLLLHPNARQSYVDAKGNYCFIHHIDEAGIPVYYQTRSNLALATSINTSKLWSGGSLGLNLQGQNMEVSTSRSRLGMWEPGPLRTTHVEFEGRAITRDTPAFSGPSNGDTDHATHVAGTMVAAGKRADVRGMANQARLDCYQTTNEYTEQQTAASEGMLVSNHSYGPVYKKGDANAGRYDADAQLYDQIAFNNRTYLQFHAAGNDRDEANGVKYDILLGGALAKNAVAIGAVELLQNGYTGPSSVVMSSFSSFGPADDGRVKPDFVTPGVQITSAYSASDNTYATIDGTSMASPGAAGSMFLLQQHYRNTKNTFMRAATLKGLGIHTAEEAGPSDGPDYSFGWGLLNMEKAVKLITNGDNTQLLEETTLTDGGTYRKKISTPGGPFKATICWTDIPGNPLANAPENDRTPSLINDLDLRLIDATTNQSITTLPWKLDPTNPSAAATHGDNVVDNTEQIYVANLPAGTYYLQVTHKSSLKTAAPYTISNGRSVALAGATQEFTVLATGLSPTALPIRLVSFKGVMQQPNTLLEWTIADAEHFSHFDLERSLDGKRFDQVGTINFSASQTAYHYVDSNAVRYNAPVYYRLKLVDLDGTVAYSRIVAVTLGESAEAAQLLVYPNPFSEELMVSLPTDAAGTTVIELVNSQGRTVRQQTVEASASATLTVKNLADLPRGVYILSVQTATKTLVKQVIKE